MSHPPSSGLAERGVRTTSGRLQPFGVGSPVSVGRTRLPDEGGTSDRCRVGGTGGPVSGVQESTERKERRPSRGRWCTEGVWAPEVSRPVEAGVCLGSGRRVEVRVCEDSESGSESLPDTPPSPVRPGVRSPSPRSCAYPEVPAEGTD